MGLIPAHAGKTRRTRRQPRTLKAHPRSRGENVGDNWSHMTCGGSSPLTRGKPARFFAFHAPYGLIPAHAGKTPASGERPRSCRAHPRSRGENSCSRRKRRPRAGSSPLTRGKHDPRVRRETEQGLIPAHAGKTDATDKFKNTLSGSSPLTRGKLTCPDEQLIKLGLIPAHAGKTLPDLRLYRADRSDLGKP